MNLLLIRHALAEPRDDSLAAGRKDAERALLPRGRRRMRDGARGLHALVSGIDLVVTSPYVRARQTADLVCESFGGVDCIEHEALAPGHAPEEIAGWLAGRSAEETLALVGHEPDLSLLTSWFVAGRSTPIFDFGKGGAALLELEQGVGEGRARLAWCLRPRALRDLSRRGGRK